ncbi:hypothetical protein F4861DRAFT_284704 [Xylaria intraflava]|nr:hypothetical protein F4861DRAFT_284704 [Xylaria intraflava]
MPPGPGSKRNTRLTANTNSRLSPKGISTAPPNGGISAKGPPAALTTLSNPGRKVKVNVQTGSVTLPRGSSVSTSFSLDNLRDVRSSSELKTPPGDAGTHDRNSHQLAISEDNNGVDDQQSTEPVPPDFDRTVFRLSSSPEAHPDPPVTRSKARRQGLTIIDEPNSIEQDIQTSSTHDVENTKASPDNKKRRAPRHLPSRDSPITKAGEIVRPPQTDEHDVLVDESESIPGKNPTSLPHKIEVFKLSSDDDEYKLPESDTTEESIIAEIRGHPKKTANKKSSTTATFLSRPRDKPVAKARAAPASTKRINRPAKGKTTTSARKRPATQGRSARSPDGQGTSSEELPLLGLSVKTTDDITLPDFISDAQNIVERNPVAEPTAPPKSKPRTSKARRVKKPFFPSDLSEEEAKVKPDTPDHFNANQGATEGQGKANSSAPQTTRLRGEGVDQGRAQKKRVAPNISQSKKKRQKGNNNGKLTVGKRNGCAIGHDQADSPITSNSQANLSPFTLSSSGDSEFIETSYEETPLKNPLYHITDETSGRSNDLELEVRAVKGKEAVSDVEESVRESHDELGIPTPGYLPRLGASPVYSDNAKNETTRTEGLEGQSLVRRVPVQLKPEETVTLSNTTGRRFLDLPRISQTDGPLRTEHVVTEAIEDWRPTDKPDSLLPVKTSRNVPNMEDLLHPNSRKWAQDIAAKSHRKSGTSPFPRTPENAGPLTPTTTREPKSEAALKDRRDAVFESIRELTASVLRHLQSKETVTDDITGIYQQNGRKLISMLLDRQAIELRQATAAFDDKCDQLGKLFEESARHAGAIQKRASSGDNGHFKDWARRSEKLLETVRKAREAVVSI